MINNRIFRVFVMQRKPPEDKNVVWFDSEEHLLKIYQNGKWEVYNPHDALLISKQDLTDKQKAQARKNINIPDYETFDDITKLSSLTAKRLCRTNCIQRTYKVQT